MAAILDFKMRIFSSTNKYFLMKYDITGVKLHFVSCLFFMKYTIPHSKQVIGKKSNFFNFSRFLHIFKQPLLCQFLSYFFQNWYTDVNLHFEQVFFFMFIKNVDSLGDNYEKTDFWRPSWIFWENRQRQSWVSGRFELGIPENIKYESFTLLSKSARTFYIPI